MIGFVLRMISGAFAPLIDQVSDFSARLLRKLALFVVAVLCLNVVVIALTIAFGMWIATLAGAIVGVLAVAGLYLLIAVVAIILATRKPKSAGAAETGETAAKAKEKVDLDSQVDDFTAPLLGLLQSLGLRREQLAVLAGASVAKRLGPVPLVGLAIVAGFLIGRTYKSWKGLMSIDAFTGLLASAGLFGFGAPRDADTDETDTDDAGGKDQGSKKAA